MLFRSKNIISLAETESTNNYAMQMVSDKAGEGTVVLAQYQSGGRGQAGSRWESEAGKNLLMSLILEPVFLDAGQQFYLSMSVSLALARVVQKYVADVAIKWPNDIYVGQRKIAGILIENSVKGSTLASSVVGIGLNLNQEKFVSDAPNPVSLSQLTGNKFLITGIVNEWLEAFGFWYSKLQTHQYEYIHDSYLALLFRKEGCHSYRDQNGVFEAKIIGIGEFGQLQLQLASGELRDYLFKEVQFML